MVGIFDFLCASKPFVFVSRAVQHTHNLYTLFDGTVNNFSNFAFTTDATTNDTYTLSEILKLDDVENLRSSGKLD